jgi:hypothetical protein
MLSDRNLATISENGAEATTSEDNNLRLIVCVIDLLSVQIR